MHSAARIFHRSAVCVTATASLFTAPVYVAAYCKFKLTKLRSRPHESHPPLTSETARRVIADRCRGTDAKTRLGILEPIRRHLWAAVGGHAGRGGAVVMEPAQHRQKRTGAGCQRAGAGRPAVSDQRTRYTAVSAIHYRPGVIRQARAATVGRSAAADRQPGTLQRQQRNPRRMAG